MASSLLIYLLFIGGGVNIISAVENLEVPDHQLTENIERPVGRAYSVFTCNYRTQPGYTCLSCHRALHCYPGNVAILVDCYGLFRYCRDGRCSRFQGAKCADGIKGTTDLPLPAPFNETITAGSQVFTSEVSSPVEKPAELSTEVPANVTVV